MPDDELAAVTDDYTRGRMSALFELIKELDEVARDRRAEVQASVPPALKTTMDNILLQLRSAMLQEQLKGVIVATELVVAKFTREERAWNERQNDGGKEPDQVG